MHEQHLARRLSYLKGFGFLLVALVIGGSARSMPTLR
jgi:hypothetical protein